MRKILLFLLLGGTLLTGACKGPDYDKPIPAPERKLKELPGLYTLVIDSRLGERYAPCSVAETAKGTYCVQQETVFGIQEYQLILGENAEATYRRGSKILTLSFLSEDGPAHLSRQL